MPWKTEDVEEKIKGLSDKQKEVWVKVANGALKRCLDDGGSQEKCEASAISQASAVAKNVKEADAPHPHGEHTCVCPECGEKLQAKADQKCNELKCPKCETRLRAETIGERREGGEMNVVSSVPKYEAWLSEQPDEAQALIEAHIHGLKSALVKERDARKELERQVREREAEPIEMLGDVIPLVEKAMQEDGTVPVKLIAPGWGTSGYYSPAILERDGAKAFPAGTQMYWDHPTVSESKERPERSLRDLAGKLVTDAAWRPDSPYGPGLYAKAQVVGGFKEAIEELAQDIGVSIRALGRGKKGTAEGKEGQIVTSVEQGISVDFVTKAGAGGAVVQLFEAARVKEQGKTEEDKDMEQLEALTEANATLATENREMQTGLNAAKDELQKAKEELQKAREALALAKAKGIVEAAVANADIPDITKTRLVEGLIKGVAIDEQGELDTKALDEAIESAVKTEAEYIAELTGAGAIRGMGGSGVGDQGKKLEEAFLGMYRASGMTEDEAKKHAALAAAG